MARKEINVFSVSFLDLLSGALAAVIILFVIVPKMDMKSKESAEIMEQLNLEATELEGMVKELENSIDIELYAELEKQFEELKQTIKNLNIKVKELEEKIQQLEQQIQQLQQQVTQLQQENEELKKYREWMENCGLTLQSPCPPPPSKANVGFKFKGKQVLFIVDASGSMITNDLNEDRMGPVKAGLKMLITALEDDFMVDVVRFPYLNNDDYKPLWGNLKPMTEANKEALFSFIYEINPNNRTPTENALRYAFNTYSNMTDIVLLTDGEPNTDVNTILSYVRSANNRNVQINCIGVGSDFFNNPSSTKVQFLRDLASQNGNGFFVDFY